MFTIGNVKIDLAGELFLIAGPCIIEDQPTVLEIAQKLAEIGQKTGIGIIFKASFDKANRTSIDSFRGPGIEKGLAILDRVKAKTALPVLTDVHEPAQAAVCAKVVDALQIPAFLCRQTDLLLACSRTNKPVNIKKGQFLSPAEMKNVADKFKSAGNDKIMLCERGTFFGYNRLVNDMTAIEQMKKLGYPVVFDATHSVQMPGGLGNSTAGTREMAPILARAAMAAGSNGLFIETHINIEKAKSDASVIMPIEWLTPLIKQCKEIFQIVRS